MRQIAYVANGFVSINSSVEIRHLGGFLWNFKVIVTDSHRLKSLLNTFNSVLPTFARTKRGMNREF